jgi:TPR repeat/Glycosyltransferase family 9 (heptosyltransferase)
LLNSTSPSPSLTANSATTPPPFAPTVAPSSSAPISPPHGSISASNSSPTAATNSQLSATTRPSNRPSPIHTQISAHLNHGHLERSRRDFPAALAHYTHALNLTAQDRSRLSEVHVAFAYLHLEQQQFPAAHQSIAAAQRADPQQHNPEIPNALGILLLAEISGCPTHRAASPRDGSDVNLHQAISAFHRAESLGHKTAASNRGNALLTLGRTGEALAAHQRALDLNPTHPGVRYNLALTQLRLGDFENGWRNYEIRWSFRDVHPRPRRFHLHRWTGESLGEDSTLFLYAEQGFGDTLQFIRYIPVIAQRLPHANFIVEVQPPLFRLLNSVAVSRVQFIAHGNPLPPFTHHCPLLSLPAIFQTTLATIPATIPYLAADPKLTAQRGRELALLNPYPKLRIGLNWAGNPNYRADHERSTHLKAFQPLFEIPTIQFISLQKGEAANQLHQHPHIYDACSRDEDFASTAAILTHLDLVITTDSAIAHLAGALAKPTWLLLPWQSDWRWMQHRLDTPWYPTLRLFRQSSPNNWPELIHRIASELHGQLANPLTRRMW